MHIRQPLRGGVNFASSRWWAPDFPLTPRKWPWFYGWMIVAIAALGIVFSIPGQTMGFSVFTDVLIRELGLSRVELSAAYCLGTVLSGFSLPRLGRMFDSFGARKMIVGSALATGLILFYLSSVHLILRGLAQMLPFLSATVISFLLISLGFYLIRAAAQGVLTMSCRNVIGKWFDYHRGLALAVSGTVTAFVFSFAPKGLKMMIDRFEWWGTWLILGVLTITVMALLGWIFIRDNPEECGLSMDGMVADGIKRGHADSHTHRDLERHEALRSWPFWAFNLTFSFFSFFSTAFTFHIYSLGNEFGRSPDEIINYFVPMAVLSVMTNLFCGWASARTRLKYLLALMNFAGLLGIIGTMTLNSTFGILLYVAGNGICGGCFSALSGIVWPRFFGRKRLGAIAGFGMSSMVMASGLGPLCFAMSHRVTGSYVPLLFFCALFPATLFIGSFFADNPQRKFSRTEDPQ